MKNKIGKLIAAGAAVLLLSLLWKPWDGFAEPDLPSQSGSAVQETETGSREPETKPALRLESLVLEPVSVEFDPEIYFYGIVVPEDTEKVLVKATAQEGITYTVSGNDNLQMGENRISIRLVSEDGDAAEYTVMVVRGEAVPAGTETEINTAATTGIAANTSAMAPPEKEGGGWLNTFWSFVTGSRLVALVLGILVLAVILLITVIVLLFRGGVKKARKQEEEKQEDQERKDRLEARIAARKQPKLPDDLEFEEEFEEEFEDLADLPKEEDYPSAEQKNSEQDDDFDFMDL